MAVYSYKAVSKTGQVFKGKMSDDNEENIGRRLKSQGLTPITIRKDMAITPSQKERKNREVAIVVNENLAKVEAEERARKERKKDSIDFYG